VNIPGHGFSVTVTIRNVVASAHFKEGIDLDGIVKAFPHVDYRPKVFPGLAFRLNQPKSCALIFRTGKMVCTGAKSEGEMRRAVRKVVGELKKAGIIIAGRPEITVQNIVASVELGDVLIDAEEAVYVTHRLGKRILYEPDQFPGAIYRMDDPQVVFLIFSTGKLVCVGAKREEDIRMAVDKLVTLLDENHVLIRRT